VHVSNDDTAPDQPAGDTQRSSRSEIVAEPAQSAVQALPEPEAQPEAPSRRRHELGSSEPRIERVVVRPDQGAEASGEAAPPPQRKGWWQRKFGGE
jgi:ribonuclease E